MIRECTRAAANRRFEFARCNQGLNGVYASSPTGFRSQVAMAGGKRVRRGYLQQSNSNAEHLIRCAAAGRGIYLRPLEQAAGGITTARQFLFAGTAAAEFLIREADQAAAILDTTPRRWTPDCRSQGKS